MCQICEFLCLLLLSFRNLLTHLNVSSRFNFLFFFLLGTAGLTALADWQSLGGDPCSNFSDTYHSSLKSPDICESNNDRCQLLLFPSNTTDSEMVLQLVQKSSNTVLYAYGPLFLEDGSGERSEDVCPSCTNDSLCRVFTISRGLLCSTYPGEPSTTQAQSPTQARFLRLQSGEAFCLEVPIEFELPPDDTFLTLLLRQNALLVSDEPSSSLQSQCEAHMNSPYNCYWNQRSLITGELCTECPPLCRGKHKSLDFIQVCAAMTLLVLQNYICKWVLFIILIRVTPKSVMVSAPVCVCAYVCII